MVLVALASLRPTTVEGTKRVSENIDAVFHVAEFYYLRRFSIGWRENNLTVTPYRILLPLRRP